MPVAFHGEPLPVRWRSFDEFEMDLVHEQGGVPRLARIPYPSSGLEHGEHLRQEEVRVGWQTVVHSKAHLFQFSDAWSLGSSLYRHIRTPGQPGHYLALR